MDHLSSEAESSSSDESTSSLSSNEEQHKKKKLEPEFKIKGKHEKKKEKRKKKIYCICKSTDTESFMIACDRCNEWYHGYCVGVSESLSKKIEVFFCHVCRFKRPSLNIKYKSKFKDFLRHPSRFLSANPVDDFYLRFQKEIKVNFIILVKIKKKTHQIYIKRFAKKKKPS